MATAVQRRQRFIRYYKEPTGKKEVNTREVAEFAHKRDWPLPKPVDPMDLFARQFSEAVREETRTDKTTKRPYTANLAITRRLSNGKQLAFWFDVDDDAPRDRMVKGLTLYREQMVSEAVIGTNTADHWNRLHPNQEPLLFPTDLSDDVEWRLNAPDADAG